MKETAVAVESSLESARLEQFRTRLAGPLAVVGSGGSFTTAALWAYLHESAGYPAWAMTPYAFAESRLPAGTRVLLLSAGGTHHDIIRTADLALRRGCETLAMTCRPESALATRVARGSSIDAVLVVPEPVHADGLIAVHGLVAFAVLAAPICYWWRLPRARSANISSALPRRFRPPFRSGESTWTMRARRRRYRCSRARCAASTCSPRAATARPRSRRFRRGAAISTSWSP